MRAELGQDGTQAALYHNAVTQLPSVGQLRMMSQQSGATVAINDSAQTTFHQHTSAEGPQSMHRTWVVIVRSLAVCSFKCCAPA